jgi:hypothetical protein
VVNDRWTELSPEQLWAAVDGWCAGPHDSRAGVCADALAYRVAIARLAGPDELVRLLALLGITAP